MPAAVVTISRQMASGGAYIGQIVARRLGLAYFDREVLQQAADRLGVSAAEVAALEERSTTLWDRIAHALAFGAPEAPYVPPPRDTVYHEDLLAVEHRIIRELADSRPAVIVGRGAAFVLRQHPALLSVFLHAPQAWRIDRARESYGIASPDEARTLVERTDRDRAAFLHRLTGREWTDATQYDLSAQTSTLGLDETAELIIRAAGRRLQLKDRGHA
ncbi:MAG TPA: cytidylate kinase-like family protein [Vicinamibacterales bacterium]|nr:cytidylate kinase-like family protein [Vicinamibacterales bacterium]